MRTIVALGTACLIAGSALPTVAMAEDSPLSFNVSVTTDYRYRGISQSRLKPALQGGIDYSLPGGFYIGTWLSSIKWIKDARGNGNVEVDLYGGYKGEIQKDLTYDVGVLTYQYPNNKLNPSANTTEVYGALTFGPATIKYSHSVTNLFGFANSKNSGYVDLSAGFDVGGGVTLTPHIGYQKVAKNGDFSYTDYSLAVAKDWEGFTFSGSLVGADVKKIGGTAVYSSPSGKNLGKTGVVVAVKKTF